MQHVHKVARVSLRSRHPVFCRTCQGSPEGGRSARVQSLEHAHARLQRAGSTFAAARRRTQRRLLLSRSPLPGLRYKSDGRAQHHSSAQDHSDPRIGTIHALQAMLKASGQAVQAQPFGRAADRQDLGAKSGVNLVAGGTMKIPSFRNRQLRPAWR